MPTHSETADTVKRAVAALEEPVRLIETQPDALGRGVALHPDLLVASRDSDLDTWRPNAETSLSAGELQEFRFRWGRFRRDIARFMADFDLLLLPAADRPAAKLGEEVRSPTPWPSASPVSRRWSSRKVAIPKGCRSVSSSPPGHGVTTKPSPPPTPRSHRRLVAHTPGV